ncbi:putative Myb-like transcription factor-like protein [Xylogone sp. PMI_703]|nr:putative Myb-like transcription factor-like protein [Xylogone sp. PMI_703]
MSKRIDRQQVEAASRIHPPLQPHPQIVDPSVLPTAVAPSPVAARNKRRASGSAPQINTMAAPSGGLPPSMTGNPPPMPTADMGPPPAKKSRTNTPWTPAEEQKLKAMRDANHSWADIAKEFPNRTEGSVKKHWYKDMHYAEFAEDESQALLNAIKEYDANKWKAIGAKVGKPAKACEQYAKEHFGGRI